MVPHLGHFAEAVLRCIETGGYHWLFIDELNRADADRFLAGLLTVLASPGENQRLPLHGLDDGLLIPKSFRLICAMNDSDEKHLVPISTALLGRFYPVRIDPPTAEIERRIIWRRLVLPYEQRLGQTVGWRRTGTRESGVEALRQATGKYIDALAKIRLIGAESGIHECEIGVRPTVHLCDYLLAEPDLNLADVAIRIDDHLRNLLLPQIERAPYEILEKIARQVLRSETFPLTNHALEVILRRRENYL